MTYIHLFSSPLWARQAISYATAQELTKTSWKTIQLCSNFVNGTCNCILSPIKGPRIKRCRRQLRYIIIASMPIVRYNFANSLTVPGRNLFYEIGLLQDLLNITLYKFITNFQGYG